MPLKIVLGAIVSVLLIVGPASAISTGQATLIAGATGNVSTNNTVDVKGFTTLVVHVCCTFDATVSFLASVDGTNYEPIGCAPMETSAGYVTSTIARGLYRCNIIAVNNKFRTDVTNYVSGTIRVTVSMTAAGVT